MQELGITTGDVLQNIKLHITSKKFSGAFILYLCAYKLITMGVEKEKISILDQDLIQEWITDMRDVLRSLIKGKGACNMEPEQISSMYEILRGIKNATEDVNVLNEAAVLHDLGQILHDAGYDDEAVRSLNEGIEVMKHYFRSNATKYKIFRNLHNILGLSYYNLSIKAYEFSMEAKQNAEDYMRLSQIKVYESKVILSAFFRNSILFISNQHITKQEHDLAFKEFEKILPLLHEHQQRFDLLMLMIECEMRSDKIRNETVELLACECKVLNRSLSDIIQLAQEKEKENQLLAAFTLYRCAAALYISAQDPDDAVTGATVCVEALHGMFTRMNQGSYGKMKHIHIRIIQNIFDRLRKIESADSKIKAKCEAKCLFLIGSQWKLVTNLIKALELFTEGVQVLKNEFGFKVAKYKLYGDIKHQIALMKCDQGDMSQALLVYEEAIFATKSAEDYDSEEERKKLLEIMEHSYMELRNKQLRENNQNISTMLR